MCVNHTLFCGISKFLSRIHWKILHLTDIFTQPAVVMVVTNMKYEHNDSSGTTCLPGHMESFEQGEKKRTQKKD